jgi:uncharacterized protein YndB with AHSA1/START domain
MNRPLQTGVTRLETPNDREVVLTRVVNAPRAVVFEVWTNPAHVPRWLLGPEGWTMPVCEIDLRPGGRWRYVWRKTGGTEMEMSGVYREVVPPERVVMTEKWGPEWPETINTVAFIESAGQTTITITLQYPSKDARDAALATGMKDGMEQSFARLDDVLRALA